MTVKALVQLYRDRKLKNYSKFTKKTDLIEFIKSLECVKLDCDNKPECVNEYENMVLKQLHDLAKERGLENFASFTRHDPIFEGER